MRFFQLQRDARGETRRLLFVFALTVALLVVAVNAALASVDLPTGTTATATLTLAAGTTSGLVVGQPISGTGIPFGSIVNAIIDSTTFVISKNRVASTAAAGTWSSANAGPPASMQSPAKPWPNGGASIALPAARGRSCP